METQTLLFNLSTEHNSVEQLMHCNWVCVYTADIYNGLIFLYSDIYHLAESCDLGLFKMALHYTFFAWWRAAVLETPLTSVYNTELNSSTNPSPHPQHTTWP